ncbi:MAG: polysaccharide deacetylase family protein [Vicinamibacterales bacterium]
MSRRNGTPDDPRARPGEAPMGAPLRERVKRLIPSSLLLRDLGPVAGRSMLFTFDDGPDPVVTREVLARLEAYRVRAVFFVIGERVERHPEGTLAVGRAGHVVGNHTYSHRAPDPWFGAYLEDVRRCQEAVARHAGVRPTLFRPPKGHLSPTSLCVPKMLGLKTMNWSLNVRDWACETEADALRAAERLVREAAPGRIVLLHDDRPLVLPLLDFVLPRLRDAGFDLSGAVGCVQAEAGAGHAGR